MRNINEWEEVYGVGRVGGAVGLHVEGVENVTRGPLNGAA